MILAGGDSFTAHLTDSNLAWPYHVDYNIINCAEMASGNELIARNVIAALSQHNDIHTVIISWSDANRFEFFLNKETANWKKFKDFFKDKTALCKLNQIQTTDGAWLKSGGGYGTWKFGLSDADNLMKIFLQKLHNTEWQYIKTLESILRVQWYCQANNIRLINFKSWNHSLFNERYDNTLHLEKMIDFDTWWFPKNKLGLREWVTDIAQIEQIENGLHPSANAQRMFAKKIIEPMLEECNA